MRPVNQCFNPDQTDKDIAELTKYTDQRGNTKYHMSAHTIADLRGLYEEEKRHTLDVTDKAKALQELQKFRRELFQKDAQESLGIDNTHSNKVTKEIDAKNTVKHFQRLKQSFPQAQTRHDRVNLIVSEFSRRLDSWTSNPNVPYTRLQLCNGVITDKGTMIGGEMAIFEAIFNDILEAYESLRSQGTEKTDALAAKYRDILTNFPALVTFARKKLVDTEGLILGDSKSFAAWADSENFGDNDIIELWDMSESVRESWQENSDLMSAFGSLGQNVRRAIATVDKIENGQVEKDDLGYNRKLDPVQTHQTLSIILRGIRKESHMMKLLRNAVLTSYPQLEGIYTLLASNDQLRTQFFCDFKKNFQLYAQAKEKFENGIRKVVTFILNKPRNYALANYLTKLKLGKPLNAKTSIYKTSNNGNVVIDYKNLKNWKALIDEYFTYEKPATNNLVEMAKARLKGTKFLKENLNAKITLLQHALEPLGIELKDSTAKLLLTNSKYDNQSVRTILKSLQNIASTGLEKFTASKDVMTALTSRINTDMSTNFNDLLDKPYNTTDKEGYVIKELEKILNVIASYQDELREESKVKCKDKKGNTISRFSTVLPSYLGDQLEIIEGYVKANDKPGLKKYIEDKFLKCPIYAVYDKDAQGNTKLVILHKWLEEIYNECKDDNNGRNPTFNENGFAATFKYKRFLGYDETPFENFTSKQQYLTLLADYDFADNLKSSKDTPYAWYPVFVMGDSNCSKALRAPRYSKAEILDGVCNVFRQELQRMSLARDFETVLTAKKLSPISNFGASKQKFVTLPWLNTDYQAVSYNQNGVIQKETGKYFKLLTDSNEQPIKSMANIANASSESIKKAFESYMQDRLISFKRTLASNGLMDSTQTTANNNNVGVKIYPLMQQFIHVQGKHFMYEANATLNTDMALNDFLMDFLYNSKFATIQQLQMFTVDTSFYGIAEIADENTGKKRVIGRTKDLQKRYKEIHAPGTALSVEAKDYDGHWYCGVTETNAPKTYETCIYFKDLEVNTEISNPSFFKALIDKFGANSNIIKKYRKNTLTDGQGYRTLKSYRKVMGMSGKWTEEMENAYKQIEQLRLELRNLDQNKAINPNYENEKLDILEKIASTGLILQPIKPYMYTMEDYTLPAKPGEPSRTIKIPVQHKYAECLLIPELLNEGKLKHLAEYMEEHDIDMVGSDKIVKVGAFGCADISKCTSKEELYAAIDGKRDAAGNQIEGGAYVHKLNYEDYHIQTNVPNHMDGHQLFGTQIKKIIFSRLGDLDEPKDFSSYAGIGTNDSIKITGKKSIKLDKGRNLLAFYNSLLVANVLESTETFMSGLNNEEQLSSMLIQSTNNNSRESSDNFNAFTLEEGHFALPLFEGGVEHDSTALILSMFKKMVNKQKIRGGSAVQASAMGLKDYDEDGGLRYVTDPDNPNNILYAEVEMPWDLTYTVNGKEVKINFKDYCNSDGTLKLETSTTTDKRYASWEAENPGEYHRPLIERDFPGILDRVAYRIPTESEYSAINIKIVRFTNSVLGGTIKVPPEGTTIAGFDFDIDKLFFIMKDFKKTRVIKNKTLSKEQSEERDQYVKEIWETIYAQSYKGSSAFTIGDILKGLQNKALEDFRRKRAIKFPANKVPDDKKEPEKFQAYKKELQDWIAKNHPPKELYHYWSQANLPGTYQEAFNDYLEQHPEEKENLDKFQMYVAESFDEYDCSKTVFENSRTARNNMLLQLLQKRLQDEATFKRRYTPGGFPHASKAARMLKHLFYGDITQFTSRGVLDMSRLNQLAEDRDLDPEPEFDPTDVETIVTYIQQNQVADALIGIFANQNTNHALTSLLKRLELLQGIGFAGHLFFDLRPVSNSEEIDTLVSESLNSSVDAVKDPVLKFLNLNTITASAGGLLLRLGYNYEELGLLLQQPIIVKLCEYCMNENVPVEIGISELWNKYAYENGKEIPISIPKHDSPALSLDTLAANILQYRCSSDGLSLEGNPLMSSKNMFTDMPFKVNQLQVLKLFSSIVASANEVNQFITNTKKTASNAVSSTAGGMYNQQMKVDLYNKKYAKSSAEENDEFKNPQEGNKVGTNLICEMTDKSETGDNGLSHTETAIDNNPENLTMSKEQYMDKFLYHPFGYEQATYDAHRQVIKGMAKYYPYETPLYAAIRNRIANLTRSQVLSEDEINSIHRECLVSLLGNQAGSDFDGEDFHSAHQDYLANKNLRGITNREFYKKHFGTYLYHYLETHPELKELQLFQHLNYNIEKVAKTDSNGNLIKNAVGETQMDEKVDMYLMNLGSLAAYQRDELIESWEELANKDFELAKDLFLFNFYKIGTGYSPLAFMNLAPVSLKKSLMCGTKIDGTPRSYIEFLEDVHKGKIDLNTDLFALQYILNHTDDYNLVYKVPKSLVSKCKTNVNGKEKLANSFVIDVSRDKACLSFLISDSSIGKKNLAFVPVVMVGKKFYRAAGDYTVDGVTKFNVSSNKTMLYVECNPLGVKNKECTYPNALHTVNGIERDEKLDGPIDTPVQESGNSRITPVESMPVQEPSYEETVDSFVDLYGKSVVAQKIAAGEEFTEDDIENIKRVLKTNIQQEEQDEVLKYIATIRQECVKDGLICLDSNGNPTKAC